MTKPESGPGGSFEHSPEYIQPTAASPLIRLEQRHSPDVEAFEASLKANLYGFSRKDQEEAKAEALEARAKSSRLLAAALQNGDHLTVTHTFFTRKNGHRGYHQEIKAQAQAPTKNQAYDHAHCLWDNLNIVFELMKQDYSYRPVTRAEDLERTRPGRRFEYRLQPRGVALETPGPKRMGFRSGSDEPAPGRILLTPAVMALSENDSPASGPGTKPFERLIQAIRGVNVPVELRLNLTAFNLSDQAVANLHRALDWLDDDRPKSIMYHAEGPNGVSDEDLIARLKASLMNWIKSPRGYFFEVSLLSNLSLPKMICSLAADGFFRGLAVEITTVKAKAPTPDPQLTGPYPDLSRAVNPSGVFPDLLPGTRFLEDFGIKKVYNQTVPALAPEGLVLGCVNQSVRDKVRLPHPDRSRHCYIIGATGTGKSSLLFNMAMQDILNGEGLCVIDPHGDLYDDLIESIPGRRFQDVVLIDPCDFDYPVGINFLEVEGKYQHVQRNFITNEMIKIFDRLYDLRTTGGPIFEQYMRNALLLLIENNAIKPTLLDVPTVFEDHLFRRRLLRGCYTPTVVSFWKNQAEKAGGEAALANMAPYICSKLNQFTSNAVLRPIIGQKNTTINFRQVMDSKKIVLVNLAKGVLGELDTYLLGMLIIGKLVNAAMSRTNVSREQRTPFYLYVDEFQNFTTETINTMMAESRKFGLYLTLANQNMGQLLDQTSGKTKVLEAVLGNVGTMLLFRLGVIDAEKLEVYVEPRFNRYDLQSLPDFHVLGRIMNHNQPQKPYIFNTMVMKRLKHNQETIDRILDLSREKYAIPAHAAEKMINAGLGPSPEEKDSDDEDAFNPFAA